MANNNTASNLGFEDKLWQAADKLRGHMDPSEYMHVVPPQGKPSRQGRATFPLHLKVFHCAPGEGFVFCHPENIAYFYPMA